MTARKTTGKGGKRKTTAKGDKGGGRKRRARRRRGPWVWAARLLAVAVFGAAAGLLGLTGLFSYYSRDLPTVDALKHYDPPQITRVVDRKGRLLSEIFEERRSVVPMERIPRVLVLSVLAAEDADFYRHRGLDYAGILRALIYDVVSGHPTQGASTITQQIVKNVLLTPERTVARKVRELILARRLEQELTKEEILHLYLNQIYFGHGRYGVQEASRFYFGKDVSKLTLAEASLIAGIPQAPSRLSPLTHMKAARQRQSYVLDQLARKRAQYWDDLDPTAIEAARTAEVKLHGKQDAALVVPEVATYARELLRELVGREAATHGGYTVHTAIDTSLQQAARQALVAGLVAADKRQKRLGPLKARKHEKKLARVRKLEPGRTYDARVTGADDASGTIQLDVGGHAAVARLRDLARYNPDAKPASEFAPVGARVRASVTAAPEGKKPARVELLLGPQGAVVVIDPRTREVRALVGGDRPIYGFNRALSAVRQPGSTFKPLVYALAMRDKKHTPASLVIDAPEVFDQWKPENYETWDHAGAVRLRTALAESINLVAVRLIQDVTPQAVVKLARELGITSDLDPSPALALGASGVKPIEMVNAYATFAAGGRWEAPRIVTKIVGPDGAEVPLPASEPPREVLDPASAYLVTSLLTSVVEEGTGRAAKKLKRPAAGKTGTSNKARDAWFVGYTPEVVAGVWVGFDDHRPLGKGESGGRTALPIWIDVVRDAVGDRPAVRFPVPGGIETARIDPVSGLLAYEGMEGAIDEVFLTGTAPTETATPPDVLDTDSFLMEQLGGLAE